MKTRDLSSEYGIDPQIPMDGSDKYYEVPEEEMYAIIDDAEARGREAARREIMHAITGMTTSERKAKTIKGTSHSNIGYNFDDGEIYKLGGGTPTKILESDPLFRSDLDLCLHKLPEEISDDESLPEFFKDKKPKAHTTTLKDMEAQLEIGWYQLDTNLIYWDGTTWRFRAGDKSDTTMSYPPKDLERMEFLG